MMTQPPPAPADGWLEQAYPEVHHMLRALEGEASALEWLRENSPGVSVLTRALAGKRKALVSLHADEAIDLEDLFEIIDNEDLSGWMEKRRPELHALFGAIRGEETSLAELKRTKPQLARLAVVVHDRYLGHLEQQRNGTHEIGNNAAADMGCLIGEMHLKAGEYVKAIEAFSRAIGSQPQADLFEGRARAYRGLAALDERRAAELRHQR
jgi:tetratricopeptide (TPR) repeat protein